MSEKTEINKVLICPECAAVLPEERLKSPWCECGWSSVTEEWVSQNIPTRLRRMFMRDRERARKLAQIDGRAAHLLSHPWGKRLWGIYLFITVFLCLPIIATNLFLYGIVLAGLGYTIYLRSLFLVLMMIVVIAAIFVYRWLTRPEAESIGIPINRKTAPQLYVVLDDVAASLKVAPVDTVIIKLESGVSIRQKLAGFWRPRFKVEITFGLLDFYSLNVDQLKSVIAHELGHIKQKDTLVGMLIIGNGLTTLQNWLSLGDPGGFITLLFFPFYIVLLIYFRLLVFVSRWAMRRQEYIADRIAAQSYGKSAFQQALILMRAINIGFWEQYPIIVQNIENNFDRRDFYNQFVDYWDNTLGTTHQKYYARSVSSYNSVFDTHPTYRDRIRALEKISDLPDRKLVNQPAVLLIPNAAELGRELTIQIYKKYRL
jgi:Zn-dependent protease with chaperone function